MKGVYLPWPAKVASLEYVWCSYGGCRMIYRHFLSKLPVMRWRKMAVTERCSPETYHEVYSCHWSPGVWKIERDCIYVGDNFSVIKAEKLVMVLQSSTFEIQGGWDESDNILLRSLPDQNTFCLETVYFSSWNRIEWNVGGAACIK